MIKKSQKLLVLLCAFAVLGTLPACADEQQPAAGSQSEAATAAVQYLPREEIVIETAYGQDYTFDVEVAKTGEDQSRGLMYRTQLNNDSGMLFIFNEEEQRTFWMKNTLIPLDLIFVGRDGTIRHIHHAAKPQDETRITSDRTALAVLEINGGLAGTLNIHEGDKILHPAFRNVAVAPE